MTLRSIETKYKGCHFRSRLEARWAVFFDDARINWQYEPQGYAVNGVPYLPDFFLRDLDCYFEVRGEPLYDAALFEAFARQIAKPLILAIGDIPSPESAFAADYEGYRVFLPASASENDDSLVWGFGDMFLRCDGCRRVRLVNKAYASSKGMCCESDRLMPLLEAFASARSARFEHGASG
jgi:hypothetical protein